MSPVHYHRVHLHRVANHTDDVYICTSRRQTPADFSRESGLRTLEGKSNKSVVRHASSRVCRRRRPCPHPYACVGIYLVIEPSTSRGVILDLSTISEVIASSREMWPRWGGVRLFVQPQAILSYLSRPSRFALEVRHEPALIVSGTINTGGGKR